MNNKEPMPSSSQTASKVETVAVKEVTLKNKIGLYARPATFFIQKANEFKSAIWIEKEERRVNAKSLLGILSLGVTTGTTIRIIADGPDNQAAVDSLANLVDNGFSETNDQGASDPSAEDVMNSDTPSSG